MFLYFKLGGYCTTAVISAIIFRQAVVLSRQRSLTPTMPGKPWTGGPSQVDLSHSQVPACAGTRGRRNVPRFRPTRQKGGYSTTVVISVLRFRQAVVLSRQRLLTPTMPGKPWIGGPSQEVELSHAQVPACAGTRGRRNVPRFRPARQKGGYSTTEVISVVLFRQAVVLSWQPFFADANYAR